LNIQLPPLSLYVHIPWCVRKCPYCDFNSHPQRGELPERDLTAALLLDLEQDLRDISERPLTSIFIGGGTPSLLSGEALTQLLTGIGQRIASADEIEITLEANPGTAEADRFAAFRAAGVNRLSIGVQSFQPAQLAALGRIHGPDEARNAVAMARDAGFDNLNLDLMFGLPGQTQELARQDVLAALEQRPEHISYYQLTLEPNTLFHQQPPQLPDADLIWEIQEQGQELLAQRDYRQYEVSAYARDDHRCRHNLNYWRFGDYLGIGPGAHGKISSSSGEVQRRWKQRHPTDYLTGRRSGNFISGRHILDAEDLTLEFLMNALRLKQGFSRELFEARTGLPLERLAPALERAVHLQLIDMDEAGVCPTPKGYAFLNDLLALFVDAGEPQ
jgi:putative oxygen-independent coproporphyrinogen III oxidase